MKKIFTSLFLIGLSISSFTQGNWVQKNNFNGNARSRGVAFTIGNNAYYGTGNYFGGSIEQSDFWKYNVATDSWTPIANFPQGMQADIGMSIGNIGYAGIDDVNIYNCVLTQQEIDSIYNNFSTVGIIEEQISDLIVFPNPANSTLTISNGKGNYKITDVFGRLVKEIKIDNEQVQINIQELKSGIYFLISKENNSSIKFIKQ